MPRVQDTTIRFDQPATVAELLDALTELRDTHGERARVRATGKAMDINRFGPLVRSVSVDTDNTEQHYMPGGIG